MASNTQRGQEILRTEPKGRRADWIKRVLADRGETEAQFLARPRTWTNGRRESDWQHVTRAGAPRELVA